MYNVHIRQECPARPDQEANDEVERRGAAPKSDEADSSRSSTLSLAHRRYGLAIARTDCYAAGWKLREVPDMHIVSNG